MGSIRIVMKKKKKLTLKQILAIVNSRSNPYPKQGEYPSVKTREKHGKDAGDCC